MNVKILDQLVNEPFFTWIDDVQFRSRLAKCVRTSTSIRRECFTQNEVRNFTGISLSKIK